MTKPFLVFAESTFLVTSCSLHQRRLFQRSYNEYTEYRPTYRWEAVVVLTQIDYKSSEPFKTLAMLHVCYVMWCHVMSCYVILCYVMVWYVIFMSCYVCVYVYVYVYVMLCYVMLCYEGVRVTSLWPVALICRDQESCLVFFTSIWHGSLSEAAVIRFLWSISAWLKREQSINQTNYCPYADSLFPLYFCTGNKQWLIWW